MANGDNATIAIVAIVALGILGLAGLIILVRSIKKPSTVIVEPTKNGGWTIIEK